MRTQDQFTDLMTDVVAHHFPTARLAYGEEKDAVINHSMPETSPA